MKEIDQQSSLVENLLHPEPQRLQDTAEVNKLCDLIRQTSFDIHKFLRSGHLEKVYENALAHRLAKIGIYATQQHPLDVCDEDGTLLGRFSADLFVENTVVVEVKACRAMIDDHVAQLLGYLRASRIEHGLLINFGGPKLQIKKYILNKNLWRLSFCAFCAFLWLTLLMDFTELIDLASERLGGAVLFANDDFFAPKENLLKPSAPVFIEGKYTDLGKWMDGWESRRRRTPGFDWCIIRLGLTGIIRGVIVDTSHFKGNYPEQCSIEACAIDDLPTTEELTSESVEWTEILPQTNLNGDSQNPFSINNDSRWTHLRFKIFPDGGVARLRLYGEVIPDWTRLQQIGGEIDLAAVENGGVVLSCSDMFFGHRHNLIMPGRAANMSDGWETKRRRGPGHDWTTIRLGRPGNVRRLEIDTSWFKGNFPESCSLEACTAADMPIESLQDPEFVWKPVLARTKLQAHTRHFFDELLDVGSVSHVRFNIFPDGGVSRLRVYGTIE